MQVLSFLHSTPQKIQLLQLRHIHHHDCCSSDTFTTSTAAALTHSPPWLLHHRHHILHQKLSHSGSPLTNTCATCGQKCKLANSNFWRQTYTMSGCTFFCILLYSTLCHRLGWGTRTTETSMSLLPPCFQDSPSAASITQQVCSMLTAWHSEALLLLSVNHYTRPCATCNTIHWGPPMCRYACKKH